MIRVQFDKTKNRMLESSKHSFTPIKTVTIFNHRISKTYFCELLVLLSLISLGCLGFFCIHKGLQQTNKYQTQQLTSIQDLKPAQKLATLNH